MRRRLLLLATICNILVLIVLAVSVLPLTSSRVLEEQEARLRGQIMEVVTYLFNETPDIDQIETFLESVDVHDGTRVGVLTPQGPVGRDAARFADRTKPAPTHLPVSMIDRFYPWFFYEPNGDRVASQGVTNENASWIVEGTITADLLKFEERAQWALIGFYYALAFAISMLAADFMALRIMRPLNHAVEAAEAMGRSELRTVVPSEGPVEVVALGRSLHALSGRIERLLDSERERAAYLSHSLRTPLTVIALEAQRLSQTHSIDTSHLRKGVADLEASLEDVMRRSRQTRSDGLKVVCDATQVLQHHLNYWSTWATLQDRTVTVELDPGPSSVPISKHDLGQVLDALLSNVFRHTAAGTAYSVTLRRTREQVCITISNPRGTSLPADFASSKVGLRVVRDTIEAMDGTFRSGTEPDGSYDAEIVLDRV